MKLYQLFIILISIALGAVGCMPKIITLQQGSQNSSHVALGNPSNAQPNSGFYDNYLLTKPQYVLSYNRSKGYANWVSWELSAKWLGNIDRQNDFRPDDSLPQNWTKITPSAYTNTGFDRGHLCPSGDRTNSAYDNSATFLMTNIVPQAPELNREAWAYLEEFCRDLVEKGYKLYITAGTYGNGGEGSKELATRINDALHVPAQLYKIIVVLPANATIADINQDTPIIAVDFPNNNSLIRNTGWIRHITTVNELERLTGLDFFSTLPYSLQASLQSTRFDYRNTSLSVDTKCSTYNGNALYMGKSGGCYYINANGKKTYVERSLCDCQ